MFMASMYIRLFELHMKHHLLWFHVTTIAVLSSRQCDVLSFSRPSGTTFKNWSIAISREIGHFAGRSCHC